jgi:hypothetical protein
VAVQHDVQTIAYPAPGSRPRKGTDVITPHVIVLFGATGFVGALTAEYLAQHAPEGVKIALAGRSEEKLARVKFCRSASAPPPISRSTRVRVRDAS